MQTTSLQQLPNTAGFAQNDTQIVGMLLSPGSSRSCGFFSRKFPMSQGFPTGINLHASVSNGSCRSFCCSKPRLKQNSTYQFYFQVSCVLPRKVFSPFLLTSRVVLGKYQACMMVWDKDAKVSMTLASSGSGNLDAVQDFAGSPAHPPPTSAPPIPLTAHQLPIPEGGTSTHPRNFLCPPL